MKPIVFESMNKILCRPKDVTDEECKPLYVYTDGVVCISCWKMSWKEKLECFIFGKIWLHIRSGDTQPPVSLRVSRNTLNKDVR